MRIITPKLVMEREFRQRCSRIRAGEPRLILRSEQIWGMLVPLICGFKLWVFAVHWHTMVQFSGGGRTDWFILLSSQRCIFYGWWVNCLLASLSWSAKDLLWSCKLQVFSFYLHIAMELELILEAGINVRLRTIRETAFNFCCKRNWQQRLGQKQ